MTQLLLVPWNPAAVQADTVVFVPAAAQLEMWAQVSTVVIAILLAVLVVLTIGAMVQMRRLVILSNRLMADARKHVLPVATRAQTAADNVTYMTAVLREDLERVHGSVASLTARLNQASDRVEERIEEFNALLEVVQSEAEGLFIDTASTVRAVREGARALSQPHAVSQDPDPEET
jgi:biopolymer transport protein ExbB/TolQ